MLVAISALTASELPLPSQELPPDELIVFSLVASIVALSLAVMSRAAALVTAVPVRYAATSLRTSLRTAVPPTAIESEGEMFRPCGTIVVQTTGFQRPRSL